MDGAYFELADGAIYHESTHRIGVTSSLFYHNKVYMMAERAWYVEHLFRALRHGTDRLCH